jgi:hypothetical protein
MVRAAEREGKRRALSMRMTEAAYHRLERAADINGRSLSAEVELRLEQSIEQDNAFGGPALRRIAYQMATSFAVAGQYSAGPNVPFEEWPMTSYITAITSVVVTLAKLRHLDDADLDGLFQSFVGQLSTLSASRRAEQ